MIGDADYNGPPTKRNSFQFVPLCMHRASGHSYSKINGAQNWTYCHLTISCSLSSGDARRSCLCCTTIRPSDWLSNLHLRMRCAQMPIRCPPRFAVKKLSSQVDRFAPSCQCFCCRTLSDSLFESLHTGTVMAKSSIEVSLRAQHTADRYGRRPGTLRMLQWFLETWCS